MRVAGGWKEGPGSLLQLGALTFSRKPPGKQPVRGTALPVGARDRWGARGSLPGPVVGDPRLWGLGHPSRSQALGGWSVVLDEGSGQLVDGA